ncbi:MAG: Pyrophosphate--fructose 6-phosphate 1-phosphotransferase [Acidobacteria bacterium]|nr:Pyrophosphate--fructose 6-phosphate 1-phosphotransferase [Acidobacteriota bacterium]
MAIKKLGILVGGGPAPGINGVIAAVALEAIRLGCTPIGFRDGFEWLAERYTDEQRELTIDDVSRIHLDGGSILGTSRADVSHDRQALDNTIAALKKLGIEALVTIGGDDLVASSAAIEHRSEGAIKVVQIPKSIDNDLPLPHSETTLGYETARHVAVDIVKSLIEDAKTSGRWFVGVTMGRPTGHLTLGIGVAASATCTIIPEEFPQPVISLADICDIVEGSIIKRRAMGKEHGVILLSEALSEHFSPEEVTDLQDVDRDAQGHIRVAEIDLGRKVKSEVQSRLEKRGVKVTLIDKTIGYELRCAPPIPYDAEHARDLGYAAVAYLMAGGSGAMITMQNGEFTPMPFGAVIDPATGSGRQRGVDVTSETYQVARDYMVRIGPKDFTDDAWVEKLAKAGGMDSADFRTHFAKFTQ